MTISYIGDPPTEDGYYLVRIIGGELDIAQRSGDEWMQIGSDYDCWQYSSDEIVLFVVRKLDLLQLSR